MANPSLIVALGKNIGAVSSQEDIRNSEDFLNLESRITADAAGMLYADRGDTDILCCGGHTAGRDIMAESMAMKIRILSKYLINPNFVSTDELSCDTRTNGIEIRNYLDNLTDRPPYEHITLLSVGFHIVNATKLIRRLGVRVDEVHASEEIVRKRSVEDEQIIAEWLVGPNMKKEIRREKMKGVLLNSVDPYGLMLHQIAKRSRA